MIVIEDLDLPITAAQKIITGTRPRNAIDEAVSKVLGCGGSADMFDLDEIKEIADYLMVYYNSSVEQRVRKEFGNGDHREKRNED